MVSRAERTRALRTAIENFYYNAKENKHIRVLLEKLPYADEEKLTMAFIATFPDKYFKIYDEATEKELTIKGFWERTTMPSVARAFIIQQYRRHLASYRIQQHWHRIRSDPRHPVGQRRLGREYDQLFGNA